MPMRLRFPDLYFSKELEGAECGSRDVPKMELGLLSLPSGVECLTYLQYNSGTKLHLHICIALVLDPFPRVR